MTTIERTIDPPGQLQDAERVDLTAFCGRSIEGIDEHMHIRFDRETRSIAFFRSVGKAGEGEWLRADIDGRVTFSRVRRGEGMPDPSGFFLTAGEADTLLTFLDRLRVEQSPATVHIEWWGQNNSRMIDETELDQESLIAQYKTESGRENRIEINSVYRHTSQMMANF